MHENLWQWREHCKLGVACSVDLCLRYNRPFKPLRLQDYLHRSTRGSGGGTRLLSPGGYLLDLLAVCDYPQVILMNERILPFGRILFAYS